ncbi:MAG TPA: 50S ribosomal protein L21 [Clostridiales bacterium]|jgi:large subunit ribosomal protein L21|nr:50S ribosomal protein L21 [Clostridiales bacterium]
MYAIVETGGKQFRVSKGDVIRVEKLAVAEGDSIALDQVMMLQSEAGTVIGNPYIDGASVNARVVENGKSKKVIIYKYKAKKNYRKKQGHRQPFTELEIVEISTAGVQRASEDKDQAEKPSLKSMKKAELIDYARANGIDVDEKATNAVLIETIEAAMQ